MTESGPRTSTFWSGDACLLVDFASRSVFVDNDEIHFTPTEFDVLTCLARRAGTVVTTSELVDVVWGEWYGPMDHVFVHVHHIRRKLGPCGRLIVTRRKAGYLLRRELIDGSDAVLPPSVQVEYLELLQQDARARDIVWVVADRSRTVTWVSDSITGLLGWDPADLVGRVPWCFAPDDEVEGIVERFPLRGGESLLSFDTRLRHANGSVVPIRIAAQVLRGADGDRLGCIGEWHLRDGDPGPGGTHGSLFMLHYDADHVLVAVEPHQLFLGWDPDDVIGTAFSLLGLDLVVTRSVMDGLTRMGHDHALGPSSVQRVDGTTVVAGIKLRLTLEDGVLARYTGEVHVLD